MNNEMLTTEEAAQFLGLCKETLATWRCRPPKDGGPPFVRLSARCIRYNRAELIEWMSKRTLTSTR